MEKITVHILGCGSALPTTRHNPSSQVLSLRGKLYLIDCGEGAQLEFRRAGLHFGRIHSIFISHLHGDHCFGLPGFLSTLSLLGRHAALEIHGPVGLAEYVVFLQKHFLAECKYPIIVHEHDYKQHQIIYEDPSLRVWSLHLVHRIPTMGFLFEEKCAARHIDKEAVDFYNIPLRYYPMLLEGAAYQTPTGEIIPNERLTRKGRPARRYAYCSDTQFNPNLIPILKEVDLLYHEATFGEELRARTLSTAHSTAKEAATIALHANVKKLLIGHYSSRYTDVSILLEEARSIFPLTEAAKEGMVYTLC